MNVQAVGNHREMVPFGKGFENVKPVEERVLDQAVKPDTDVPPSGIEAAETGEKGVIRLLQESHFRGVADARLRINFSAELQQATAQKSQATFEDGLAVLIDELRGKVGDLFNPLKASTEILREETAGLDITVDEALADFETGAHEILASFKDGSLDMSSALAELREMFSGLVIQLEATFGAAPTPAIEDTDDGSTTVTDVLETIPSSADETETAEAPAETVATSLQELKDWFDKAVGEIEAAMTASQALPPLSEPSGKGAAYGKFLEIYNSLTWGWKPQAGTQEQAAGIDVLA